MDEQMIADIADALAKLPCRDTQGISVGFHDLDIMRRREAARAIASVMAGKVAELTAALELWLAYDDQDEADFAQAGPMLLYARAIDATRAALAPHPKGME